MAGIWHVVSKWTGGNIGTGFTNLFFTEGVGSAQQCVDSVRSFFSQAYSAGAALPTGINISVQPNVDAIDPVTGHLTGSLSTTAPSAVVGSDSGRYAALAGACVTWRTGDFSPKGKRIRGRTFLVPVGSQALQQDGTIDTTLLGFINLAASTLILTAPELVVWERPGKGGSTPGSPHVVLTGIAADKTAYLTSRR